MPARSNPLKLNPLQLKTLTLLQELAGLEGHGYPAEEDGHIRVTNLPRPHGDHFHLGPGVVRSQDASGLGNAAAWAALERKGLIRSEFPRAAVLTPEGMAYDTGLRGQLVHHGGHH